MYYYYYYIILYIYIICIIYIYIYRRVDFWGRPSFEFCDITTYPKLILRTSTWHQVDAPEGFYMGFTLWSTNITTENPHINGNVQ